MPTYDYSCSECGHNIEVRQKITDAPLTSCPHCKCETLQRGIGGGSATFRFVGEGFYINDYKKDKTCAKSDNSCCPCKDNS